jgi:hypothetical protein
VISFSSNIVLSNSAKDLIKKMLKIKISERITILDAMKHKYFENEIEEVDEILKNDFHTILDTHQNNLFFDDHKYSDEYSHRKYTHSIHKINFPEISHLNPKLKTTSHSKNKELPKLVTKINHEVDDFGLYNMNYNILRNSQGTYKNFMNPIGHTKQQKVQSNKMKKYLQKSFEDIEILDSPEKMYLKNKIKTKSTNNSNNNSNNSSYYNNYAPPTNRHNKKNIFLENGAIILSPRQPKENQKKTTVHFNNNGNFIFKNYICNGNNYKVRSAVVSLNNSLVKIDAGNKSQNKS